MDNRVNNGGARGGAGRKPKADEIKLIEALDRHIDSDKVFDILQGLIEEGNIKAIQIYLDRRYGKPKESVTLNSEGFNISFKDILKFDKHTG
jgi:hypothetical protein